jgi:hypothetical protein
MARLGYVTASALKKMTTAATGDRYANARAMNSPRRLTGRRDDGLANVSAPLDRCAGRLADLIETAPSAEAPVGGIEAETTMRDAPRGRPEHPAVLGLVQEVDEKG